MALKDQVKVLHVLLCAGAADENIIQVEKITSSKKQSCRFLADNQVCVALVRI
jgi:hypothetical protein